jgi:D-alanyl-D-alanine carboxypeptidase (penicillin-binding protein 5/6)
MERALFQLAASGARAQQRVAIMSSMIKRFTVAAALAVASAASVAQQATIPAPAIDAKAYLLIDFHSGQPLAGHNATERVEPASLTKLMTAYLTFSALARKSLQPEQAVPVSERASRAEGSRMFIEPRRPVTVNELIRGVIVQSGNDACIALAEAIAGNEEAFAQMMNRQARELGMRYTNFVNSTGLPHPQHYSTAHDLALLAAAIVRDFPDFFPLYSAREFRYNNITQANRNRLLWTDPTVDGMKTGLTENAGYCLIASARRGERRLISVVLGAASDAARAAESQKLLKFGFQAFDTLRLYEKDQPVATLQVWKGSANQLRAGFARDLYLSLPKGQTDRLKASMESLQPLLAPIAQGQRVGTMKLLLDGKAIRELPVVALENVPLAGIFGRGWDSLRLLFR